jgi:stage II sporulation protein E
MARMESVISKNKLELRIEMHTVLLIIISFLLGRVNILDRLYPFGIAFIGAYTIFKQANKGILAATMLGTISAQGLGSLSYIITSLLIYVFFTRNRENSKYSLIVSSMIVISNL